MADWFPTFLSSLHRDRLKPLGFRKDGRTFSRDRGPYVERFNVQASSWSNAEQKRLYLNAGLEFKDLPQAINDWSYFPRAHEAARANRLVPGTPPHWDCSNLTDPGTFAGELAEVIVAASDALSLRAQEFRAVYLERTGGRG